MRHIKPTKELKVAIKMSDLVNDLTLDLDQVGTYIATNDGISYRRFQEVAESAKHEREQAWKDNDEYNLY
jgi:hypothetical protein